MTSIITQAAIEQLARSIGWARGFKVTFTLGRFPEISPFYDVTPSGIIVNAVPPIVLDEETFLTPFSGTLDYDAETHEFVIRRPSVIPDEV